MIAMVALATVVCMVNVPREAIIVVDNEGMVKVVDVKKVIVEVANQDIVHDYIIVEEVAGEDTARYEEAVRCARAAQVVNKNPIVESVTLVVIVIRQGGAGCQSQHHHHSGSHRKNQLGASHNATSLFWQPPVGCSVVIELHSCVRGG
jgi:hypothetical protein